MAQRSYWWACLAALMAAVAGTIVGVVRWLGPDALVLALSPLGRAPLWVGTLLPQVTYVLVQSLPGGRAPLWFRGPPHDGWSIVLGLSLLCATMASWPVSPGGQLDAVVAAPAVLVSAFFLIDRTRRVQRLLAAPVREGRA